MNKEEIQDVLGILFIIGLFLLNSCVESFVNYIDPPKKEIQVVKYID